MRVQRLDVVAQLPRMFPVPHDVAWVLFEHMMLFHELALLRNQPLVFSLERIVLRVHVCQRKSSQNRSHLDRVSCACDGDNDVSPCPLMSTRPVVPDSVTRHQNPGTRPPHAVKYLQLS